jgi:ATP-binding cassette subfamily G (WHITE) protein 2 (PDR)
MINDFRLTPAFTHSELLLFLDEPTSGLDSQTSWSIIQLLQKLADHGQAILCTIHQPSAQLFSQFNRLLLLAAGGKQIYFGEVGRNSETLISYFERNGARPCGKNENPAEYMLSAIGATPGSSTDVDWHQTWLQSPENEDVKAELDRMKRELPNKASTVDTAGDKASHREFAATFWQQMREVLRRVFQQWWRTPSYIWSKFALCAGSSLFIGFSFFNAGTSVQALQNQLFSIFMLFAVFGQLVQQIMPHFVIQVRALSPSSATLCSKPYRIPFAERPIRGARTACKDIQLESLHAVQHYRRTSLEQSHGDCHLFLLVLSYRIL